MSKVRLYGSTSGYVELAAPDVAGDVTITLPNTTGAFATEPYVDAAIAAIPGIGSNVVQTVKLSTFTTNSTSFVDVTDLDATITLTSDTSKVLVMAYYVLSQSGGSGASFGWRTRILRDATAVFVGTAVGSRTASTSGSNGLSTSSERMGFGYSPLFVDNPGTVSPVTYKVQLATSAGTAVLGRTGDDPNSAAGPRMPSSIILVEVTA